MLKILTIFFGLLIIVTRGLIALSPVQFRNVATNLADNKSFLRGMGVFVLVLSILVFVALDNDLSGARAVMAIIAAVSSFGALLLLVLPAQYAVLVNWFAKLPDSDIRFLACIGVIVGILVVILGFTYY
jgi:uncharacterized protein YjeT (DUF2065 family)